MNGACDFTFHLSCESWNPWMTIFSIFRDFEWKTCQCQRDFTWNCWNYTNQAWTEIYAIELKWNAILWNGENCLWTWIFRDLEFTDPSLVYVTFLSYLWRWPQVRKWSLRGTLRHSVWIIRIGSRSCSTIVIFNVLFGLIVLFINKGQCCQLSLLKKILTHRFYVKSILANFESH